MNVKLCFDDIIYKLQKEGGVSTFWREITSRVINELFETKRCSGCQLTRYLPVLSNSNIFHSSYYRLPSNSKAKVVVTVHDFIYELKLIERWNSVVNIHQVKSSIARADAIVCVSQSTKDDLLRIYPKLVRNSDIYVIAHGTSFCLKALSNRSNVDVESVRINNYVLFVGRRSAYKNFRFALDEFAHSDLPRLGFSLICVGKSFSEVERKMIAELYLETKVISMSDVGNDKLSSLYQNAFALIYPSLYEGFGLPPLEAMSCGCPVIASDTSSIPEVVGDAGILINPHHPGSGAEAFNDLLYSHNRLKLIDKGISRSKLFTWDVAASSYIDVYKSLI